MKSLALQIALLAIAYGLFCFVLFRKQKIESNKPLSIIDPQYNGSATFSELPVPYIHL